MNCVNCQPDTPVISQADEILAHLEAGHSLTPAEALDLFGCARLGARIWDLRRAGHDIERELITVRTRRGRAARIARYRLATANAPER